MTAESRRGASRAWAALLLGGLLWAASASALAAEAAAATKGLATALPGITSRPGPGGGQTWSLPVQTLLALSALAFLPALILLMTGFTRIVIVLSLLRQALGTQSAPPNQVLIGLSLFLTVVVMTPTLDRLYADAYQPLAQNEIGFDEALGRAEGPMREFMLRQTRDADLALFSRIAKGAEMQARETVPLRVLVPAFVTSELKTAFQIGFMIFIPFLIIDMVVASVLTSMGMMMLSPMLIALPFKLMLFVLVDGWNLLLGSLVSSFGA